MKMLAPAEQLEGTTLPTGWIVGQRVTPVGTGGNMSVCYLVSHPDGRQGFLKAMDYSRAFFSTNTADMLQYLSAAYIFEREICVQCDEFRITRVVHALEHGSHVAGPLGPYHKVEYLIFERADGDVRAILDQQPKLDLVFAFATLHGAAAALNQLHLAGMAHQDLKPSNLLIFRAEQIMAKLGDLGRSWSRHLPAPHDGARIAGDTGYAPLELLMNLTLDDDHRRIGVDLYLLGSLVVFFFCDCHINALIMKHLDPSLQASRTPLTHADLLPYFQRAFADALAEFSSQVPSSMREKLTTIVAQLCDPDHTRRGNPGSTGIKRFGLVRYISMFDALRRQAEVEACSTGQLTCP
jgi:eukaryotic-like serine/threonine-protein kinase